MGAPTDDWESGFRALTKFVELKGHAGPAGRVHAFGIDLGGWVARRRIAYWDGTLSAGEADLLENLPGWTWGNRDAKVGEQHCPHYRTSSPRAPTRTCRRLS